MGLSVTDPRRADRDDEYSRRSRKGPNLIYENQHHSTYCNSNGQQSKWRSHYCIYFLGRKLFLALALCARAYLLRHHFRASLGYK
jgi:hypothetical protein